MHLRKRCNVRAETWIQPGTAFLIRPFFFLRTTKANVSQKANALQLPLSAEFQARPKAPARVPPQNRLGLLPQKPAPVRRIAQHHGATQKRPLVYVGVDAKQRST